MSKSFFPPFTLFCLLSFLFLSFPILLSGDAVAAPQEPASAIDLAHTPADVDLSARMAVRDDAENHHIPAPDQALAASGWVQGDAAQTLLESPRERSTIWLSTMVENVSDAPLTRWIELSPWRLTQVDAWAMNPASGTVLSHVQTGTKVPLEQRAIKENNALVPVTLQPGERQRLLIRVHSTSRPFLTLKSFDPVALTVEEAARFQLYSIALACILTLLAVLLLQGDRRYALIGVWMLVAFVFESGKEGYISQALPAGLANYAYYLRYTTWILTSALFLTVSVVMLGQYKRRGWRLGVYAALGATLVFGASTLVLDGDDMRNLGSLIDLSIAAGWLGLVPQALRQRRPWQRTVLTLLGAWWLVYSFVLLGYVFNFYYTAEFAAPKVVIEIVMILGLLLVYARQKRTREQALEQNLRRQEREYREVLEHTVAQRTRELRLAMNEAREANAAKTDFLARISHDLRSPLTSIMGYAQLLSADAGQTGHMSRTIYGSANHMLNLVERLIGYARGTAEKPVRQSDMYLLAFIDDIGREAEITARNHGHTFRLEKDPALPPVIREDATLVRQILLNLLDNAAKYTHQGRICLSVSSINNVSINNNAQLTYCVEDTGDGMPEHVLEHLWEPFYQARERHDSSCLGLGMAIVHQLTEQLGGTLDVASRPGEGTRITLTLPVTPGKESDPQLSLYRLPHHVLPYVDATGLTAWVVEDASAIRELLDTELGHLGFTTRLFADAETFMQAFATATPDLVLTDHALPKASGDTVLATALARQPHTPVVLLSATRLERHQNQGYAAMLTKPMDLATLRRTLARVCQRELHTPSALTPPCAADTAACPTDLRLSAAERRQLESLVELGAVTDLMEWSQARATQVPGQTDAAHALYQLAQEGRFSEIQRWLTD